MSDPNSDALHFSLSGQTLSWLIVNYFDGSMSGTPQPPDLGTVINASLVVSDGYGDSDSVPITGSVSSTPPYPPQIVYPIPAFFKYLKEHR